MTKTMHQTNAGPVFGVTVQNTGELYIKDDIRSTDRLENRVTVNVTSAENQKKTNSAVMLAPPFVGLNDQTDALYPRSD